jgi:hypothetical protein
MQAIGAVKFKDGCVWWFEADDTDGRLDARIRTTFKEVTEYANKSVAKLECTCHLNLTQGYEHVSVYFLQGYFHGVACRDCGVLQCAMERQVIVGPVWYASAFNNENVPQDLVDQPITLNENYHVIDRFKDVIGVDWGSLECTNFSKYYLDGMPVDILPTSITLVNIKRIIDI